MGISGWFGVNTHTWAYTPIRRKDLQATEILLVIKWQWCHLTGFYLFLLEDFTACLLLPSATHFQEVKLKKKEMLGLNHLFSKHSVKSRIHSILNRTILLLSQQPNKSTEFRSYNGRTVQQRGRKQWSLRAKLRIQIFLPVCSQVGWQGVSAGWWLSGASDSLSQGDHCHMPVCPQHWQLTRPTWLGRLVMPSLSAVGWLWQLTRHLGHGQQGLEHCYLYRHQYLLLPRKRVRRRRKNGELTRLFLE